MLEFLAPRGLLELQPSRWFAVAGTEPLALPDDVDPRRGAPEDARCRIVVLDGFHDGGVFLDLYTTDLAYITDAWFRTVEDGLTAAGEDHDIAITAWQPIPDEAEDAERWVFNALRSSE